MKKACILIVNGEHSVRNQLVAFFATKYHVLTASNSMEALQVLHEQEVSLIIGEDAAAEMNGYMLCKVIKSALEHSHIPFVMLVTPGAPDDKVAGLGCGVDVYVEKPFSTAYLGAQVASLLENRARIRAYFTGLPFLKPRSAGPVHVNGRFQETLEKLIEMHLSNPELNVKLLVEEMHMSRPLFYRKVKDLCSDTPYRMIDRARLKRAALLIAEGRYRLSDISAAVGFNSPAQFSKNFKRQFGVCPSGYA